MKPLVIVQMYSLHNVKMLRNTSGMDGYSYVCYELLQNVGRLDDENVFDTQLKKSFFK